MAYGANYHCIDVCPHSMLRSVEQQGGMAMLSTPYSLVLFMTITAPEPCYNQGWADFGYDNDDTASKLLLCQRMITVSMYYISSF